MSTLAEKWKKEKEKLDIYMVLMLESELIV